MAARFSDLEIQARMFGPLVLGCDDELGWLHAAAYVTDLLGASARTGSSCGQQRPNFAAGESASMPLSPG
jgi:hypothetical protein